MKYLKRLGGIAKLAIQFIKPILGAIQLTG